MSAWEIIGHNNVDVYKINLFHLQEQLRFLSKFTKIIWLNQYPLIEKYANNGQHSNQVYSEKILRYNLAAREIFKY